MQKRLNVTVTNAEFHDKGASRHLNSKSKISLLY